MSHLLDEKILETLTYERSKTWSNFLKVCEIILLRKREYIQLLYFFSRYAR